MALNKKSRKEVRRAMRSLLYEMENLDDEFPDWPRTAGKKLDVKSAVKILNREYKNETPNETWPVLSQALVALRRGAYSNERTSLIDSLVRGTPKKDRAKDRKDLTETYKLRGTDFKRSLVENVGSSPLAIDEDASDFFDVTVAGVSAVYIQSTFSTNVPYKRLRGWLNPENWPKRAPLMFDVVKHEFSNPARRRVGFSIFDELVREQATPTWDLVENYLRCGRATYEQGRFAITSYDLDPNHDQDVLVDHGYLLLADRGKGSTMVGFVKLIGFKQPESNESVKKLRPFWLTLIRAIAEGDYATKVNGRRLAGDKPEPGSSNIPTGELARRWIGAASSGVGELGSFAGSTIERLTGPKFGWNQYRDLLVTYWQRIGESYADAWRETQTVFGGMGPQENGGGALALVGGLMAAGAPRSTSIVPAPGTTVTDAVVPSDLVHISDPSVASIGQERVSGQIVAKAGAPALRLEVDSTGAKRGVYVGTAIVGSKTIPTYVFVSDAVRTGA